MLLCIEHVPLGSQAVLAPCCGATFCQSPSAEGAGQKSLMKVEMIESTEAVTARSTDWRTLQLKAATALDAAKRHGMMTAC